MGPRARVPPLHGGLSVKSNSNAELGKASNYDGPQGFLRGCFSLFRQTIGVLSRASEITHNLAVVGLPAA